MQHFFAQEIEAKHRRREFARAMETRALIARATSKVERRQEPGWRRRWIAWWRSLAPSRFASALVLPTPMALSRKDA